ncbi:MAG: amino acid adenylation domain-containing protein [bacterium]|nr:amino acid adenylation domain-containing protein [bacterium]
MTKDTLTTEDTKPIPDRFNDTAAEYPADKTIHQLFEEQVLRTPGNIAAVGPDMTPLTYLELNRKANALAHLLRSRGVGPGVIVALVVERSLEMVIGIFAILKAGGAYLPIAPNSPEKRMRLMLEDSQAKVVLTQTRNFNNVAGHPGAINLEEPRIYGGNTENPEHVNQPDDLVYVIYTSGSTGLPKGVMIRHYSLVNRLNWMQKSYPLDENDRIMQKTPFVFDVSVWEFFWWSMVGAAVCFMRPGFEKFPQAIIETVEKNNITTMHFVPSMMSAFLGYIENSTEDIKRMTSLKRVFNSGEALKPDHVKRFHDTLHRENQTRLINLYGPTEATVDVTYFNCSPGDTEGIIPIGKPIDNTQLLIMDENQQLCPVGSEGELWIAGSGVALGYLNRPELTAEKFNKDFKDGQDGQDEGKEIYKTGDLARWMPDGNVEFLGRIDHQVKIRGLRIELGEIEAVLANHPAIRDCVVLVNETSETIITLKAFLVVNDDEAAPDEMGLKKYLKDILPDYMIPGEFMFLDELPLTPNGKVDRKALSLSQPD